MTPQNYNKQFDELIDRINKLRSDIVRHFKQRDKLVGWHKSMVGSIVCLNGEAMPNNTYNGYGQSITGAWYGVNEIKWCGPMRPCPPEEVEAMLIAEAKRRGYGPGVTVRRNWIDYTTFELESDLYTFSLETNVLTCNGWQVFNNGQWAEVVKPAITIDRHVDRTIIHASLAEEQIQKVKEVLG